MALSALVAQIARSTNRSTAEAPYLTALLLCVTSFSSAIDPAVARRCGVNQPDGAASTLAGKVQPGPDIACLHRQSCPEAMHSPFDGPAVRRL